MAAKHYTDRDLILIRNRQGENLPVPPLRKKPDNEEHRIQAGIINWWRAACAGFKIPEHHLLSIPNGGRRDPIGMVFLKREGLRVGCPDLFLAVGRRGKLGLWVEVKKPNGVLSSYQNTFILSLRAHGYDAYACYSFESAIRCIELYLLGQEMVT